MGNPNIKSEFHALEKNYKLTSQNSSKPFGRSYINYEIYKRSDVSSLGLSNGYVLVVTQKFTIPNQNKYAPGISIRDKYESYPAIIQNTISVEANNNANVRLYSVFPKTINTSVTTNEGMSSSDASSVRNQVSSGSSMTNVNTFGVSASVGFFGELPIGQIGLSYSHSWVHGLENSISSDHQNSHNTSLSSANSMSVKDWSAYSDVDIDEKSVNWFWAQSYPWDVLIYNQSKDGKVVNLPKFIQDRMLVDNIVRPPSELSQFGVEFVNRAVWLIDYPDNKITESEEVKVTHDITNICASHSAVGDGISATIQSSRDAQMSTYETEEIDLSLYALSPLVRHIGKIGFNVDEFTYFPNDQKGNFKIVSSENDLQVTGTGFDAPMTSMFQSDVSYTIYFKLDNKTYNYILDITHWVDTGSCEVDWTVNGKFSGNLTMSAISDKQHKRYERTETIALRDSDYTSSNYHDFLKLGLNRIEVKVRCPQGSAKSKYYLSSIAIR